MEKKMQVSNKLMQDIVNYLGTRPLNEVLGLHAAIFKEVAENASLEKEEPKEVSSELGKEEG